MRWAAVLWEKSPSHELREYGPFSCHSCKGFWKGGFHKVFVLWFRPARPASGVRRAVEETYFTHCAFVNCFCLFLFLAVGDTFWAYCIRSPWYTSAPALTAWPPCAAWSSRMIWKQRFHSEFILNFEKPARPWLNQWLNSRKLAYLNGFV